LAYDLDKSCGDPYKTHCGAWLSRTGAKLAFGLFYIHIEPGGCFVAAGFWHPDRNLIVRHALTDADVLDPSLTIRLLDRFTAARPLLDFGWEAVDG
jgi:uncharacterized protein (DUF2461 family)